ncbi:GGDEF domain-containing protein [Frankia sp. CNm7]|uniref:GGDEF domain-containing protein n=1 Tax=Frankia nepalensis TaxID=1836974 RepID=A0A937REU0_9ACTN|nr:GGDEF domain-containing protein [Frankia nepalensis]MBL7496571.1 GGDEF domain-containing protein [Frankia nepalensis]MBL7508790.1 GGDEF domain-containing protein [Frankia nepalensis]MBL7524641.1 GGDEF domain-containing protein [Frankia nepalensis]MBL7627544.1 GGDEF domain-containing protein [Frankia nepalensis]
MVGLRIVGDATPDIRRSAGSGHGSRVFSCAVVACLLLVGLAVVFDALLAPLPGVIATTFVTFASEIIAAVAAFWSARRAVAGDRRWRVFIGLMATGLAGAGLVTILILLTGGSPATSTSSGYASLVFFYGLALAGLLCLPTYPAEGRGAGVGRQRHGQALWRMIVVLDCVLIVGSVVLLEWGTVLGDVVRVTTPNTGSFVAALIHEMAVLILAVVVLLIASFRRPWSPATLGLLGSGLLIYGLTGNVFVYRVAHERYDLPAWSLIPFIVAILLMALAALVPVSAPAYPDGPARPRPRAMWVHAALPYAALCAAGLLILGKLVTGTPLDRFEVYGMVSLLVLALARQMITIAENTRLLTEIRERESQLHYQAFHDPLTGLANRALFTRRLQRAVISATMPGRNGALAAHEPAVSVLFVDLDRFKRVNDEFGHAAGDELLKISASRLRAGTRAADTVARLGGDEFAVILDGGGPDDPRRIAERLAAAVQEPCRLAGRTYVPRASLGLVTLDGAARPASPDVLLHQADLAMYAAKRERAGKVVVFQRDTPIPADHDHPGRH